MQMLALMSAASKYWAADETTFSISARASVRRFWWCRDLATPARAQETRIFQDSPVGGLGLLGGIAGGKVDLGLLAQRLEAIGTASLGLLSSRRGMASAFSYSCLRFSR